VLRSSTRRLVVAAFLVGAVPAVSVAQQRQTPRSAAQLRGQINERFMVRIQQSLQLDDATANRLSVVMTTWSARRDSLEIEERRLRASIASQLRPGVAADSVALTDALGRILRNRIEYAELFEGEMSQLRQILSPVQRGQLFLLREQLFRSARELIQRRPQEVGRP
jgi:hypothetical protein